jgi:hypothetical protein
MHRVARYTDKQTNLEMKRSCCYTASGNHTSLSVNPELHCPGPAEGIGKILMKHSVMGGAYLDCKRTSSIKKVNIPAKFFGLRDVKELQAERQIALREDNQSIDKRRRYSIVSPGSFTKVTEPIAKAVTCGGWVY